MSSEQPPDGGREWNLELRPLKLFQVEVPSTTGSKVLRVRAGQAVPSDTCSEPEDPSSLDKYTAYLSKKEIDSLHAVGPEVRVGPAVHKLSEALAGSLRRLECNEDVWLRDTDWCSHLTRLEELHLHPCGGGGDARRGQTDEGNLDGTVECVMAWGAFVKLPEGKRGLIHRSDMVNSSQEEAADVNGVLNVGDSIKVDVAWISEEQDIVLRMKAADVERLQLMKEEAAGGLSAKLMMELRDSADSGVRMMDCKKALMECNGDVGKSIAYLRENGLVPIKKRESPEKRNPYDFRPAPLFPYNFNWDRAAHNEQWAAHNEQWAAHNGQWAAHNGQWAARKAQWDCLVAAEKANGVPAEGMVASYIHPGARLAVLVEVNCVTKSGAQNAIFQSLVRDVAMQIAACPEVLVVDVDDVPDDIRDKLTDIEMQKKDVLSKRELLRPVLARMRVGMILEALALLRQPLLKDGNKTVAQAVEEAAAGIREEIWIRRFVRYQLGESMGKSVLDPVEDLEVWTTAFEAAVAAKVAAGEAILGAEPAAEAVPAVPDIQIPAELVTELWKRSGAGMMDCKTALVACEGDIEAAADYLCEKRVVSAEKAGHCAVEGAVGTYISDDFTLGVLVEVNCETDFVARSDKFKELLQDLAMQIAACPEVSGVAIEDVPASELENERRIKMEKEDIKSKPEATRADIVDGRVAKIAKERALLEQSSVKFPSKTVAEVIKEASAEIGENIQVRRFTRIKLAEGIEEEQTDFAAVVDAHTRGAQTGGAAQGGSADLGPEYPLPSYHSSPFVWP